MKKYMTRMRLMAAILMAAALTLGACRRRPIYEEGARLQLLLDIDYDLTNVENPHVPEVMMVEFYSPQQGNFIFSDFVGPEGGEITVAASTYDLLIYNYDTEYTQLRDDGTLDGMLAYTNRVPSDVAVRFTGLLRAMEQHRAELQQQAELENVARDYADEPLVNQPDHLYVGELQDVEVPPALDDTDVVRVHAHAASLAQTWRLEIGPMSGMENVRTADVYVTGQVESVRLHGRLPEGECCAIYVPILTTTRSADITTTFTTFGHYAGSHAYVVLQLSDFAGNQQIYEWDVTDQFDDPANTERVIRIHHPITVLPAQGQGMDPQVVLWGEHTTTITI